MSGNIQGSAESESVSLKRPQMLRLLPVLRFLELVNSAKQISAYTVIQARAYALNFE